MTLDEFAAVTRRVIEKHGFGEFQPTATYPQRCHLKGGACFPCDVPESHILQWAGEDRRDGEEMLVAFKIDGTRFKSFGTLAHFRKMTFILLPRPSSNPAVERTAPACHARCSDHLPPAAVASRFRRRSLSIR